VNPIIKDLSFLEAGIPEIKGYLLSKELYWPISVPGNTLPRLTIGGILLTQTRLEARGERIEAFIAQLDGVRSKWQVAWETKASREVQARMRLWSNYLSDYRHDPEQHADVYPHEVRYRVILNMLFAELPTPHAEQDTLKQLDSVLRVNLIVSDFIWESELQSGFSRDEYWFLYGKLNIKGGLQ